LPSHVPSFHAFIITDPQVAEFLVEKEFSCY
jgi:hypothetical protein